MTRQGYESQLLEIVQKEEWLMRAFHVVRDLYLPDWFIAGGILRNTVLNVLHQYPTRQYLHDIDIIFYDVDDANNKKEHNALARLHTHHKDISQQWDVVNQAHVPLFQTFPGDGCPEAVSSAESIAYWSETVSCIGMRLEADNTFTICAPHGLDDLFNCVIRPVPPPYEQRLLYLARLEEKEWQRKWPRLRVIPLKEKLHI